MVVVPVDGDVDEGEQIGREQRQNGEDSGVKKAVGRGTKEWVSFALYVAAVVIAFVSPPIAVAIYVAVAAIWLIPDRRFVRA